MKQWISDLGHRAYISIVILVIPMTIYGQGLGCTDPQAINYNPNATQNDGSCLYETTINKPKIKCVLQGTLRETSGLSYFFRRLWSHNDSGADAEIWMIQDDSCTLTSFPLSGIEAIDWEDMAQSKDYLFVGDFGNNSGSRRDLKIYIIDYRFEVSGTIEFTYPDQTKYTWPSGQHPYDCEAMIFRNDSLHLFTKDRQFQKTRHYRLPSEPGSYEAELIDSLDIRGFITAADINDRGTIALLGYRTSGEVFQYLLFDYPGGRFFEGHKREILLGPSFEMGQAEGLCFTNTHDILYSNEDNFGLPARLLSSNIQEYTDHITRPKPSIRPFQLGDEWVYELIVNSTIPARVGHYTVAIVDTVTINGHSAFELKTSNSGTKYMFQEGSQVYFWNATLQSFELNYDFEATNGYYSGYENDFQQTDSTFIDIMQTGTAVIDDTLLHFQHARLTDFIGYRDTGQVRIWKDVGFNSGGLTTGANLISTGEFIIGDLRCFQGQGVDINFKGYPCDTTWIITSTHDQEREEVNLLPNPTSNFHFHVRGQEYIEEMTVFNTHGQLIREYGAPIPSQIRMPHTGIFYVLVHFKNDTQPKLIKALAIP